MVPQVTEVKPRKKKMDSHRENPLKGVCPRRREIPLSIVFGIAEHDEEDQAYGMTPLEVLQADPNFVTKHGHKPFDDMFLAGESMQELLLLSELSELEKAETEEEEKNLLALELEEEILHETDPDKITPGNYKAGGFEQSYIYMVNGVKIIEPRPNPDHLIKKNGRKGSLVSSPEF